MPPVNPDLATRSPELRARNPEPEPGTRNPLRSRRRSLPCSAPTAAPATPRARGVMASPRAANFSGARGDATRPRPPAPARSYAGTRPLVAAHPRSPRPRSLIDDPKQVNPRPNGGLGARFDSWAIVDACCTQLFNHTPFAIDKGPCLEPPPGRIRETRSFLAHGRTGRARQAAPRRSLLEFLPIIAREATDERNFVKKAVNWALRQIGKRNAPLRRAALATAKEILALDTPAARWIARDAIRELKSR